MLLDVPTLFLTDGVHADVVRAGEPRLRRDRARHGRPVAVRSSARVRLPLLRRSVRLLSA